MVKIIGTVVIAAAMLVVLPAFAKDKAGDMACCAKNASNQQSCANLASLCLTLHYDQIHCVGSGGNVCSGHAVRWRTWRVHQESWKRGETGLHGFTGESQPDA